MVAHGLWAKHQGKWELLRLRASRPTQQLLPDFKKLSRAVVPQRVPITRAMLADIAREIVTDATDVQLFREKLFAALAPSRYKPLPYTRHRPRSPKKRTLVAQPRSSQKSP